MTTDHDRWHRFLESALFRDKPTAIVVGVRSLWLELSRRFGDDLPVPEVRQLPSGTCWFRWTLAQGRRLFELEIRPNLSVEWVSFNCNTCKVEGAWGNAGPTVPEAFYNRFEELLRERGGL